MFLQANLMRWLKQASTEITQIKSFKILLNCCKRKLIQIMRCQVSKKWSLLKYLCIIFCHIWAYFSLSGSFFPVSQASFIVTSIQFSAMPIILSVVLIICSNPVGEPSTSPRFMGEFQGIIPAEISSWFPCGIEGKWRGIFYVDISASFPCGIPGDISTRKFPSCFPQKLQNEI